MQFVKKMAKRVACSFIKKTPKTKFGKNQLTFLV
jgi:hypothetical protein